MKVVYKAYKCKFLISIINRIGAFFPLPIDLNAYKLIPFQIERVNQKIQSGTSQPYENLLNSTMLVKKIGFINQKGKESGWKNNF
jgi:hypothetical protein